MDVREKKSLVDTAVIVAAGMGTRLQDQNRPQKPLMPIMGIPLIGRVMESAAQAGIKRFYIVTGYQAENLSKELPGLLPESCELKLIHNSRFKEPNGVSLQAALEKLSAPFALLMSDHIFSPIRLKKAIDHFSQWSTSHLVVESKEIFNGDLEDATLVAAATDGNITAIGKELIQYDAIDTGMFILDYEVVRRAFLKVGNSPGISDVMRVMIQTGDLGALYLTDGFWQDIDTPEDIDLAREKILKFT